jgi:hypothetical protein
MTSRPLFARVAESIVIFAPIVHVGWRSACSGDGSARSAGSVEERTARRREDERRPSHLLAGEALPDRRVLGIDRPEPGERARERRRPSRSRRPRAARGGERHHEVAARDERLLVRGRDDLAGFERGEDRPEADDAAGADDDEVDVVARRERFERVRRRRGPAMCRPGGHRRLVDLVRERDRRAGSGRACSARSAALEPAASATTSKAVGCARGRRASGARSSRSSRGRATSDRGRVSGTRDDIQRDDRRGEQERVDAVEDAAVARDQRPRVLRAGGALEHRLGEVAGLRGERDERPEHERRTGGLAEPGEQQRDDDRRRDDPPTSPAYVFDGEMWVEELAPPEAPPDEVRPVSYDQTPSTSSRIQPRSAPSAASGAPAGTAGASRRAGDEREQRRRRARRTPSSSRSRARRADRSAERATAARIDPPDERGAAAARRELRARSRRGRRDREHVPSRGSVG